MRILEGAGDDTMMTLRKAEARGHAKHGWLDSHHTFSFADYYDPEHMGFRALRVINDDRVEGGQGFGSHSHADMEIISYVLEGALAHKDSMGTGAVIKPGDVQRMSAGTGVVHSEFNASTDDEVHFLQIWLVPNKKGVKPSYEQKAFSDAERRGKLRLVVAPDSADGSVAVNTDARVYAGIFGEGDKTTFTLPEKRYGWVHVARGKLRINDVDLSEGDGVALENERELRIEGVDEAEILVFDLA
jgi:redox-sensitive bicupin YhaK (pirin superfamily)